MKAPRSFVFNLWLCVLLAIGSLAACKAPANDIIIKTHLDSPTSPISSNIPVTLEGWVLSTAPIQHIEVSVDGQPKYVASLDIPRPDVLTTFPEYKSAQAAGFKIRLDSEKLDLHDIHQLRMAAVTAQGSRYPIGETTIIASQYQRPAPRLTEERDIFYILFATSDAKHGGLQEIRDIYGPLESSTIKVGIRVPILYMRTTHGRTQDWAFDPDFDTRRKCGDKTIAEDALNSVIQTAIQQQLPVLFTLNGGIWADARCDVPEWDINDELEKDPLNCQWDLANEVHPDDYLQHLPGSENSPELARALTFNVHADKVRHYKKRNLQQAARLIRKFQLQNPRLFVGVTLDPDVYVNPFFESPRRLHDYNPNTVRQFREWLQGIGPYAQPAKLQARDLRHLRLQPALSLDQVNAIAGKKFPSWDAVDPPRPNAVELAAIYLLPEKHRWVHLWEIFRRHLVDVQYDELSEWVAEVGIDPRYIQSAQGIHENPYSAVPIRINSPLGRYDSGGASIEGAVPSHGHLGVIIYGKTSENLSVNADQESLFAVFREFDPDWGIVEFNTARLNKPKEVSDFGAAYRAMRDSFNYGARYVSPMAWNGSNGIYAQQPGFIAYTSVRNTHLDIAIRRLMRTHTNLPRGSKLWTFGTQQHPKTDGWTVNQGAPHVKDGRVTLVAKTASPALTLESPRELSLSVGNFGLWLQVKPATLLSIDAIEGRTDPTAPWTPLVWQPNNASEGRYQIQLNQAKPIDQIRIRMQPTVSTQLDAIELRPIQILDLITKSMR